MAMRGRRDDDRRAAVVQAGPDEAGDGVGEELLGLVELDDVLVPAVERGT